MWDELGVETVKAYLSSSDRAWTDVVYSSHNELTNSTHEHADHEEYATSTDLRDHAAVNDNSNDAYGSQDA